MPEWFTSLPTWAKDIWFIYVTGHDFIQWVIMAIIGLTAWGQRNEKKKLQEILEHVHEEIHLHMEEDAKLHEQLGQGGMTRGS